jgi:hypothetical protein
LPQKEQQRRNDSNADHNHQQWVFSTLDVADRVAIAWTKRHRCVGCGVERGQRHKASSVFAHVSQQRLSSHFPGHSVTCSAPRIGAWGRATQDAHQDILVVDKHDRLRIFEPPLGVVILGDKHSIVAAFKKATQPIHVHQLISNCVFILEALGTRFSHLFANGLPYINRFCLACIRTRNA